MANEIIAFSARKKIRSVLRGRTTDSRIQSTVIMPDNKDLRSLKSGAACQLHADLSSQMWMPQMRLATYANRNSKLTMVLGHALAGLETQRSEKSPKRPLPL